MQKPQNTTTEALFGAHAIIEALKAKKRKIVSVYTTKPTPKAFERVKPFLPAKCQINYVSRDALTRICGSTDHMGIVAWMGNFQYHKKPFTPDLFPKVLLLDNIQDVRNLGAILRSAYCAGFTGVILNSGKGARLSPAAIKASAGLAEHLAIYQAPSSIEVVNSLKSVGYSVLMAVINGEDIRTAGTTGPVCLVIGNEEKGLAKELTKKGIAVTIPQKTPDISYNASVAAGILMFYLSFC